MKYFHRPVCLFLASIVANSIAAQPVAIPDGQAGSQQPGFDLTGYWQQEGGQIFYFTQEGASLTSRHSRRSSTSAPNDVDFSATIYGNLVYGAHRAGFIPALPEKCSGQLWVGMGLTLNEQRSELTGFRGDRIVDPKNCTVKDSVPVRLVYVRVESPES